MTGLMHEKEFSRKRFLKGGALIVGFSFAGPLLTPGTAEGAVSPFASAGPYPVKAIDSWIAIHADNTATAYLGGIEAGQGTPTGLLQIVAEELDLAMGQMRTVTVDTNVSPNLSTGASTGIQGGGPKYRQAAAEARQALLNLASATLGVPSSSLTVSQGVVSGGGKTVTYGDLLGGKLFNLTFTGTAPTKPVSSYKLVTTSVPRIDIPDKVTGKTTYAQNVRVPGMVHGRVVRPRGQGPYGSGAPVVSVDASSIAHIPNAQVVRKGNFLGVVTPKEYDAIQAAAELKVEWQPTPTLPGDGNLFGAMRAATTVDKVLNQGALGSSAVNGTGDVAAGFARATKIVSGTFTAQYQMHGALGPNCAVADVTPSGALVMCSTQGVYGAQTALAQVLGLPASQVRVQYYDGGGSYGHTTYNDVAEAAAIMSQAVGTPVRVQFMRWDEHGWDNYAPSHIGDVRAGIDATNKIVAYDYTGWSQDWVSTETSQELTGTPITVPRVGGAADDLFNNTGGQYTLPNSRLTGKTMPMLSGGLLKASNMRAPLGPQTNFGSEQIIDQLALAAGMDPVAFRLHNQTDDSVVYWTGVLNAVAKLANWQPKLAASKLSDANIVTGRGIALGTHTTPTSFAGVVADIQVNKKTGKITAKHLYAAMDVGLTINPGLVENQMSGCLIMGCSRALSEGVRFSKTNVTSLDWVTYPILRFQDSPNVTTVVVQRTDQPSSGAGEENLPPVVGAIANAFFDATGVRMHQMPMTPGAVRATLKEAGVA